MNPNRSSGAIGPRPAPHCQHWARSYLSRLLAGIMMMLSVSAWASRPYNSVGIELRQSEVTGRQTLTAAAPDSVIALSLRADAAPIEGLWQLSDGGAIIAITASASRYGLYDVTLLDCPDWTIEVPQMIGTVTAGGESGTYDMRLQRRPGNRHTGYRTLEVRLQKAAEPGAVASSAVLAGYTRRLRVNLWRWLPYMFRATVTDDNRRPSDIDGMYRIYPAQSRTRIVL